ncbi:MAG: homoaconitate hydratase family protein [Candidatus Cloacimonadota bacterium]|nr:MAG: homoaconitate hydratase family protein [Candidatus Cloacimonadota bacterium]
MGGKTIIEKIFENHSKDKVQPGNFIWLDIDYRAARDFGGANVVQHLESNCRDHRIKDREKTFFTFDTCAPAKTIAYANNQHKCRLFARQEEIKVFDVDAGIGSHVAIEEGLIFPGTTAVSTDSHMNIVGAIGAFGQGMGDVDIAFVFKSGKTWFEVPQTIRINLEGKISYPTTIKDVTLKIVGTIGSKGALGKSMEYYGDIVDKLKLCERLTLSSMATEMAAIISFIPPSESFIRKLRSYTECDFEAVYADKNAKYAQEITIDIDGLKPQIALPPSPDNVKPVSAVLGKKIDSVFIGSCTNGRYCDMKIVANFLDGKTVAQGVMLRIVPATKKVYQKLLDHGDLEKLFNDGAIISNPGCGGCAQGQIGMTGEGEVQLSTSNRNFPGKQGAGDTYLVSPLIAAASAVKGEIALPE